MQNTSISMILYVCLSYSVTAFLPAKPLSRHHSVKQQYTQSCRTRERVLLFEEDSGQQDAADTGLDGVYSTTTEAESYSSESNQNVQYEKKLARGDLTFAMTDSTNAGESITLPFVGETSVAEFESTVFNIARAFAVLGVLACLRVGYRSRNDIFDAVLNGMNDNQQEPSAVEICRGICSSQGDISSDDPFSAFLKSRSKN